MLVMSLPGSAGWSESRRAIDEASEGPREPPADAWRSFKLFNMRRPAVRLACKVSPPDLARRTRREVQRPGVLAPGWSWSIRLALAAAEQAASCRPAGDRTLPRRGPVLSRRVAPDLTSRKGCAGL